MKLDRAKNKQVSSATIAPTLWLTVVCLGMLAISLEASQPAWWNARGAVNSGATTNDYAAVNQGQLKQFTARAVDELNSNVASGAGTPLTNLVYNWKQDYATNYYSTNAIPYKPSDFQVVNVGNLKYVGNLVWNQLQTAGYTNALPSWLASTNATDYSAANIGQLKTVFNFDVSTFASLSHLTSASTATGLVGTAFSYTITANNSPTSIGVTGSLAGLNFNSGSNIISGIPTAAGNYYLTVTFTNASGKSYGTLLLMIHAASPVITSPTTASGVVGTLFNYTIKASNNPTTFTASSLPAWLTLNASNGIISGTPTTNTPSSIMLGASNAGGTSSPVTLNLTVNNPPAPVINSGTVATGNLGVPFSYTILASNNPTNFTATGKPSWANINAATGVISGTPTSTGISTITMGASNAGGSASTVSLSLTINSASAPIITSGLTAVALQGVSFSYSITASGSPTSFSTTGLPAGLTVNSSTGAISGSPTSTSTSPVFATIKATNSSGTGSATLVFTMNLPAPVISSSGTAVGQLGTSFSYSIVASNNPTSFTAPNLPLGLGLDSTLGIITGAPLTAGTFTVTLGATNAKGTGTASLVLTVSFPIPPPAINSGTVATGDVGVPFNYTITVTTTNSGVTFTAPSLPAGLSVNSASGLISGTPTNAGTTSVTLGASNSSGTSQQILNLTINNAGAPVISSAVTAIATAGSPFSYSITASNSPTNYSVTGLPVGLTLNSSTGVISGTPIAAAIPTLTLGASNSTGTGKANLTLTVNPPPPVISSATSASGVFGMPFTTPYQIVASNNPTNFNATGLPPGLIVDAFSGKILGTPTASGSFSVALSASNAGGPGTSTLNFTISVGTGAALVAKSVAQGEWFNLLLKTDGTVWASGQNESGQLGNGTTVGNLNYVPVSNLTGVIAVTAESFSGFALKSDGSVWSWGYNDDGELGNKTDGGGTGSANSNVPVQVLTSSGTPLMGIVSIASGQYFTLALQNDGSVWAWGADYGGALGNGDTTLSRQNYAAKVVTSSGALSGMDFVACGGYHGMAIKNDGTLWCWGANGSGELGTGTATTSPSLVAIASSLTNVSILSGGGGYASSGCSVAVKGDGSVWSWGDNTAGRLGVGTDPATLPFSANPVNILSLSGVVAVSVGPGSHVLALKSDGTMWAWGNNAEGELGNGTSINSNVPVQVFGLSGMVAMSAGVQTSTAIRNDGSVWSWGASGSILIPQYIGNRNAIPAPSITPAGGSYSTSQTISISSTVSGTIHYTLDGTQPTAASPTYTGSFVLSGSALVSAGVIDGTGAFSTAITGTQYYINDAGNTGLPTAPTGLSAVSTGSGINLSWTLSGTANYNAVDVFRSSDGGSTYQLITVLGASATGYLDTNVQSGASYKYKIGTLNSFAESDTTASGAVSPTAASVLTITVTTPTPL